MNPKKNSQPGYLTRIVYSSCLFTISPLIATSGGWPQPEKGGFVKADVYYIDATRVFNDEGEAVAVPRYTFLSANIYAEAGFTKNLTGIVYFPFLVRSETMQAANPDKKITESAPGDLDIGVRYGFLRKDKLVMSGVLMLGVPSGRADDEELLWTGDGEFNQLVKLEAGYSFPYNVYAVAGGGFNKRSGGFSDEIIFDAEVGATLFDNRINFALKINGRSAIGNGDDDVFGGYGMFSNNTEYFAYGPDITLFLKNGLGISVNTFGAFYGRNLLAAPSVSAGIVYRHIRNN